MSGVSDASIERVVERVLDVVITEPSQRWRDGIRDVIVRSLREDHDHAQQGEAAHHVEVQQPAGGQVLGEPDAGREVDAGGDQQGSGEDLLDHVSDSPGEEGKDRGRGGRA